METVVGAAADGIVEEVAVALGASVKPGGERGPECYLHALPRQECLRRPGGIHGRQYRTLRPVWLFAPHNAAVDLMIPVFAENPIFVSA